MEVPSLATILVAREKSTRMTVATVGPMEGASVEHPVRRTLSFLEEIGLEGADVVFKSDQEPALKDLLNIATSKMEKFDKDDIPGQLDEESRVEAKKETLVGSHPWKDYSRVLSSGKLAIEWSD